MSNRKMCKEMFQIIEVGNASIDVDTKLQIYVWSWRKVEVYCWLTVVSMQFGSGMKIYAKY